MGTIYILESNNFYKIGITTNLEKRLKTLQVGNPFTIKVITSHRFKRTYLVEQFLHGLLSRYRKNGEWFDLDTEQLVKVEILLHLLSENQDQISKKTSLLDIPEIIAHSVLRSTKGAGLAKPSVPSREIEATYRH